MHDDVRAIIDELTDEPLKRQTWGALLGPTAKVETENEASEYFAAMLKSHMISFNEGEDEAASKCRSNIGYFSGYFDQETMCKVQRLFRAAHPVFGTAIPKAQEAFDEGKELGNARK